MKQWLVAIVLALAMASAMPVKNGTHAAPKGKPSHTSDSVNSDDVRNRQSELEHAKLGATTTAETGDDRLRVEFEQSLLLLYPTIAAHDARTLAEYSVLAVQSGKFEPLDPPFQWIHARVTGSPRIDAALKRVAQDSALKQLSAPVSASDIRVMISGISADATRKLQLPLPAHALQGTEEAARIITSGPARLYSLIEAFRPFKGKLLILVAHHKAAYGSDPAYIELSSDGKSKVRIDVSDLRYAEQRTGVRLLLLGCKSGLSMPVGPTLNLDADQAAAALSRLFAAPINSLADVASRLADPQFRLAIDSRFAGLGGIEVVDIFTPRHLGVWILPAIVETLSGAASAPSSTYLTPPSLFLDNANRVTTNAVKVMWKGFYLGAALGGLLGLLSAWSAAGKAMKEVRSLRYWTARAMFEFLSMTVLIGLLGAVCMLLSDALTATIVRDATRAIASCATATISLLLCGGVLYGRTYAQAQRWLAFIDGSRRRLAGAPMSVLGPVEHEKFVIQSRLRSMPPPELRKLLILTPRSAGEGAVIGVVASFAAIFGHAIAGALVLMFGGYYFGSQAWGAIKLITYSHSASWSRAGRALVAAYICGILAMLACVVLTSINSETAGAKINAQPRPSIR